MCRSIRVRTFNSKLDANVDNVLISKYPAAHANQIRHYMKYTLENDHPDNVIIVAGSNDVAYDTAKGVADAGVIAERILQIAADAKAAGVQEVFISSIMKRRGKQYMNIINDINIILQLKCLDKGYHFVDNSNISLYDLSDGLHLNPYGNIKFMGNLLRCCESYNPYLDGDYLD